MMSNGTSGDINNIPFGVIRPPREPFEQIRTVAQKAADTAWLAQRKIEKHRAFSGKRGELHAEIYRHRCGPYAAFCAHHDDELVL